MFILFIFMFEINGPIKSQLKAERTKQIQMIPQLVFCRVASWELQKETSLRRASLQNPAQVPEEEAVVWFPATVLLERD